MSNERYMRQVFDGLHLLEGVQQSIPIGDCAVIGHQDGIMVWNERGEARCNLKRPRNCVFRQRHRPKSHHRFLTKHVFQSSACTGEGRSNWWMRMNDRSNVVSVMVDGKMHADLARYLPRSLELSPLEIDDNQIRRPQHELTDTRRSNQQTLVIQPNGEIA